MGGCGSKQPRQPEGTGVDTADVQSVLNAEEQIKKQRLENAVRARMDAAEKGSTAGATADVVVWRC